MEMAAQAPTASELPLEQLLALYGYTVTEPEKETCHLAARLPDMTLDKGILPEEEEEESSADEPSVTSNSSDQYNQQKGGMKHTLLDEDTDEESDDASIPSNEEHKAIMVGSMYQAKIPSLCPYACVERDSNSEDQLLWKPGVLPVKEVEEYLFKTQKQHGLEGTNTQGDFVRDNEQALYELVKCNFNAEEALRRLRFNVKVISEEFCGWSEEECRNFEHGYRVYGKNFNLIQANKVRTRSIGECVQYYYMWKKSDRHEYFTQQATRLSRKKYSLQTMEDGDQEGDVVELEARNSCSGLLSKSSLGSGQLKPPVPPQSNLELDKHDGDLVTGLSVLSSDSCPQGLFGRPFPVPPLDVPQDPFSGSCYLSPVQLLSSSQSFQWVCGSPPSCHGDMTRSCLYQLHMCGGKAFICEGSDCGGTSASPTLQVEISPHPSCAAVPPQQRFGSLLHMRPVQHHHFLTQ